MRKTKIEKGITLIALIITIVVLLILAVVAINSITNDGILSKATDAATKWNLAVNNEKERMNEYENFLNGLDSTGGGSGSGSGSESGSSGGQTQTVTAVKNNIISTESNTEVVDAYGNKIVVPAGFKIVVDSTTNNADTVTKGIVIEDSIGNQFIWIPVGKIYTDTARTEANAKTITLGRYENFTATDGVYTPAQTAENYATATTITSNSSEFTEDTKSNHKSSHGNTIARDIGAFVTSATTKGGYYIGRYEARTDNMIERTVSSGTTSKVTCIKTNVVYNYVTQPQASSLAQEMYGTNSNFTSDLINSYAWDTAIIFLQEFDNRADKTTLYSRQISLNSSFSSTGTTEDIICNVYDMASNCIEYTTETAPWYEYPATARGGGYCGEAIEDIEYRASTRDYWGFGYTEGTEFTFRTILYLG